MSDQKVSENARLQQENADLRRRIAELEAINGTLENVGDDLRARLAACEGLIRAWRTESFTLEGAIKYLIACDSALSANIKQLRTLYDERKAARAALAALRARAEAPFVCTCGCQAQRWATP